MRAALKAGIASFDTADAYANTGAESVLGEALKGERRQGLESFTKVFFPTGPGGAVPKCKARCISQVVQSPVAQLAVARVLQNSDVAAAIISASRPEQVAENAKASGVRIPAK